MTKGKGKRVHPLAYRAARKATWGGILPHALRHEKSKKKTSEQPDDVLVTDEWDASEGEVEDEGLEERGGPKKVNWWHMMHRRRQKVKTKKKKKK